METPATSNTLEEFYKYLIGPSVAFIIAVFSTIYALYQGQSSKKEAEILKNIANALTTKYLGEYPSFVHSTIDILQKAKVSIVIVCDYPCYSYFSDHNKWMDYRMAIEKAAHNGLKVTIKFLNESKRRELVKTQFRYKDSDPDAWKNPPEIETHLKDLLRIEKSKFTVENITFHELLDIIEQAQKLALTSYFKMANLEETADSLPLYYWIIDDKEAIFSIPSFTEYDKEKGFYTSDPKLIDALGKNNVLEFKTLPS